MAVQEGEDAALTCRATGNPPPRVTWKKEDGDHILLRKPNSRDLIKSKLVVFNFITTYFSNVFIIFSAESYNGSVLRLTRLERKQMGAYLCIASNDVPPAVSKRVSLSVHCK